MAGTVVFPGQGAGCTFSGLAVSDEVERSPIRRLGFYAYALSGTASDTQHHIAQLIVRFAKCEFRGGMVPFDRPGNIL